jgi:hypothetical protein
MPDKTEENKTYDIKINWKAAGLLWLEFVDDGVQSTEI